MITVRSGGCVYGPGVFMFECEAAAVKSELISRKTKLSERLASEIGMPSDGIVYAGEARDVRPTPESVAEWLGANGYDVAKIGQGLWSFCPSAGRKEVVE